VEHQRTEYLGPIAEQALVGPASNNSLWKLQERERFVALL